MHKKKIESVFILNVFLDITKLMKEKKIRNPRFNHYCESLNIIIEYHSDQNIGCITLDSLTSLMKTIYFKGDYDSRSAILQVIFLIIENYSFNIEKVSQKVDDLSKFRNKFLSYWQTNYSLYTLPVIKSITNHFLLYLYFHKIFRLDNINENTLYEYIYFLNKINNKCTVIDKICKLRCMLKYAFENHFTEKDYSQILYGVKSNGNLSLPDSYSISEIQQLIQCINIDNEYGKRQYVVVLIAALFGIRSVDISLLKINDINWDKSVITFIQSKTKKEVILYIPDILQEAILDYLSKRTDTQSPYLITHLPKNGLKGKLSKMSISRIVHEAFVQSNIDINNRKSHAHVLRHSLANQLINAGTPIATISEILGHSSIESTKVYTKINIDVMRFLALEVPIYE